MTKIRYGVKYIEMYLNTNKRLTGQCRVMLLLIAIKWPHMGQCKLESANKIKILVALDLYYQVIQNLIEGKLDSSLCNCVDSPIYCVVSCEVASVVACVVTCEVASVVACEVASVVARVVAREVASVVACEVASVVACEVACVVASVVARVVAREVVCVVACVVASVVVRAVIHEVACVVVCSLMNVGQKVTGQKETGQQVTGYLDYDYNLYIIRILSCDNVVCYENSS